MKLVKAIVVNSVCMLLLSPFIVVGVLKSAFSLGSDIVEEVFISVTKKVLEMNKGLKK